MDDLKRIVIDYLDQNKAAIAKVSRFIHDNPEVGYQERKASTMLVEFLAGRGFQVTYPAGGLETAFKASVSHGSERPHLAILAEYDALPGIGHGCGHNLIAAVSLGAGIALSYVLHQLSGRVSVIGTPAEEVLVDSGKMRLIEAGLFDDVDAVIMAHPHNGTWLGETFLAANEISVQFTGQSAHSAADPDLGINAYDAIQLTFVGISFLRQQLRSDARVHWGNLKVSGAKNIIPDFSSAIIDVRSRDDHYVDELTEKVVNCIKGAALMTGCMPEYQVSKGYRSLKLNPPLEELYRQNLGLLGVTVDKDKAGVVSASTDMGNVSKVTPAIHPFFKIADGVAMHSVELCRVAATKESFNSAMEASKALAMTAVDLLVDPVALKRVKEAFLAT